MRVCFTILTDEKYNKTEDVIIYRFIKKDQYLEKNVKIYMIRQINFNVPVLGVSSPVVLFHHKLYSFLTNM